LKSTSNERSHSTTDGLINLGIAGAISMRSSCFHVQLQKKQRSRCATRSYLLLKAGIAFYIRAHNYITFLFPERVRARAQVRAQ